MKSLGTFLLGLLLGGALWRPIRTVFASGISMGQVAAPVTWQVGGVQVAAENVADFRSTDGILVAGSHIGGTFRLQVSPETGFAILSRATDQSGANRYCISATGNDSYSCFLNPTLLTYTPGSCLTLTPDTANTGSASLDVDTLGSRPILTHSGATPANGDIPANLATLLCLNSDATAWSRP